jgi:hypothetical protein
MKAMVIALMLLALGAGSVLAAGPLGDDASTDRTIPLSTSTTASSTTTTATTGTTTTEDRRRDDVREPGEDVRGPCDEAEHANDPRCAGGAGVAEDDRRGSNSGRGSDDTGSERSGSESSGHGGSDDDRSGSNSGSDD